MPWIYKKLHICKSKGHENFESTRFCFGPDGYRKNDRKRAVVWPWLVLELSTVWALTQLGIRQSDWWRAGIRSTNLHIVVEYAMRSARRPEGRHPSLDRQQVVVRRSLKSARIRWNNSVSYHCEVKMAAQLHSNTASEQKRLRLTVYIIIIYGKQKIHRFAVHIGYTRVKCWPYPE